MKMRSLTCVLFLISGVQGWAAPKTEQIVAVRNVSQIRRLSLERAQAAVPAHLSGTVMVLSGWKNSFFFADKTAGISVDRNDTVPELHSGDQVEVDGVTGAGKFAPVVISEHVRITGRRTLPGVRVYAPEELYEGQQDSQWIAVRGVVRSAEVKHQIGRDFLVLTIDMGRGRLITARVLTFHRNAVSLLNGATVKAQGICGSVFNTRRQFVGPRLFLNGLSDIHIEHAAPPDPFSGMVTPLADLLRFGGATASVSRVKLQGVVTYEGPGTGFYLQDGSQGLLVSTEQQPLPAVGAGVEVIGYPETGSYSPVLANASFRLASQRPSILPTVVDASALITSSDGFSYAPHDSLLVKVTGKLLQEVPGSTEHLLLLRGDQDVVFSARLPVTSARISPLLSVGSVLTVTGVCSAVADASHEARSIELLLRSTSDVHVLKAAPWWTAAHAIWIVGGLVLVTLAMSAWVALMRRQARIQELITLDPLTGLLNRRGFLLLAEREWQIAIRRKQPMLLFFVDLDHFKQINDSLGHRVGDNALRAASALLRGCFRKTDVIGRLGGDEFAIIAVDGPDLTEGTVRKRLDHALRVTNSRCNEGYELALSVGVLPCDISVASLPIEDLLARADILMYEQKRVRHVQRGGGQISVASLLS